MLNEEAKNATVRTVRQTRQTRVDDSAASAPQSGLPLARRGPMDDPNFVRKAISISSMIRGSVNAPGLQLHRSNLQHLQQRRL
jgi:hypothetical protein